MQETTLSRPWGRLKVRRGGSGRTTLLVVHGLGGSGRYWAGLEDALGDRVTLLAPDLIGAGGSSKPRRPYDLELFLDCLDASVPPDGSPVLVAGHSLGAVLALVWASRNPERVAGLAMISSPYPTPNPNWDPSSWAGPRASLATAVVGTARVAWPVLSLPAQVLAPYPRAVVRDYGRQTAMGRAWTLWTLWSDPALEPVVRAAAAAVPSHVPILLAHALDDRSIRPTDLDRWASLIPAALVVRVERGGHQLLIRSDFSVLVDWFQGLVT